MSNLEGGECVMSKLSRFVVSWQFSVKIFLFIPHTDCSCVDIVISCYFFLTFWIREVLSNDVRNMCVTHHCLHMVIALEFLVWPVVQFSPQALQKFKTQPLAFHLRQFLIYFYLFFLPVSVQKWMTTKVSWFSPVFTHRMVVLEVTILIQLEHTEYQMPHRTEMHC